MFETEGKKLELFSKSDNKKLVNRKAEELVELAIHTFGQDAEYYLDKEDGEIFGIFDERLWDKITSRAKQILVH